MGQLPPDTIDLIQDEHDVELYELDDNKKIAYVTQTTLSVDDPKNIIKALKKKFPQIKEPFKEDICYATTNRQSAVKNIAKQCDMFFVLGSRNSSNSVRLVEVAEQTGCPHAELIHSESEIPFEKIQNCKTIGVSSGASAPEVLVENFINKLKDNFKIKIFNSSVSGETTGGGVSRINKVLDELKPTFVLLELGGNDALRGYPPDRIYQNLLTMINACKDRGIEVFLMQIKILPNYGKRYQNQFESVYSKVSAASGVTLIPFMLEEVALNKELMFDDGIHPNEAAQPLIAKFVFESLRSHLK